MKTRRTGTVRVRAYAKVNLTLRVLGLRPDGYHDLRTTFQSIALHDTLTFTLSRGPFRIECDDPKCPADDTNLVSRAAHLIWRERGISGSPAGVTVHIAKRIPIAGGLGGGSSDAAATLRALNLLWRARLDAPTLLRLARELGADVPFFLEGGTALGVDRGDTLFPLVDLPRLSVVLVLPLFGVNTRDAYAWWDSKRWVAADEAADIGLPLPTSEIRNDLQAPVNAHHPDVGRITSQLFQLGATYAAMSGSGSTVFGLFDRPAAARRAAAQFSSGPQRALVTHTLSRRQHAKLGLPVRQSRR